MLSCSAQSGASVTPTAAIKRIGRLAVAALHDELALYPKPGLVSFVDSGSHQDMDARTFMRSLFALRHCFPQMAALGAVCAPFSMLERAGIAAEARMLLATDGVNTHRGAIFSLGLLCAGAGTLLAEGQRLTPMALRLAVQDSWGRALGARATQRHAGLRGAGTEAALGFPLLFEVALPALQQAQAAGLDEQRARLQTLFHIIAKLDDTNLVHRGGLAGLRFAQAAARDYLDAGGAAHPEGVKRAVELHRVFVARRLSPGGAADMLACACWLQRVCA